MGKGLFLAALSGAGNAIADNAKEYQALRNKQELLAEERADAERMLKLRADAQVDLQRRLAEVNRQVEDAPLNRYSAVAKDKLGEQVAAPVTSLSGIDPKSEYEDPESSPDIGFHGDPKEARAQIMALADPEMRELGLRQLDRQIAAEAETAGTRNRTTSEASLAAMEELRVSDPAAYKAAKDALKRDIIQLGPSSTALDGAGNVIYHNDAAERMQEAKLKASFERQEKDIAAKERMTDMKFSAMAKKDVVNPVDVESAAHALAAYQEKPLGERIRGSAWGIAVMNRVREINPEWDGKRYGEMDKSIKAFSVGKQGDMVRSFNVAIDHIATAEKLANALKGGDITVINTLANKLGAHTGATAPTSYEAVRDIVADEIVKAVVGGAAALADRDKMAANLRADRSPEQLYDVLKQFRTLMRGQLDGLRDQYTRTTGRDDFDSTTLSREAKNVAMDSEYSTREGEKPAAATKPAPAATPALNFMDDYNKNKPDDGWGAMRVKGG